MTTDWFYGSRRHGARDPRWSVLALALRHYRERAGLTQAEAAKRIKKGESSIGNWEAARNRPSIYSVRRLAQVYGVTEAALLAWREPVVITVRRVGPWETGSSYLSGWAEVGA